jgi:hypothetical protein
LLRLERGRDGLPPVDAHPQSTESRSGGGSEGPPPFCVGGVEADGGLGGVDNDQENDTVNVKAADVPATGPVNDQVNATSTSMLTSTWTLS